MTPDNRAPTRSGERDHEQDDPTRVSHSSTEEGYSTGNNTGRGAGSSRWNRAADLAANQGRTKPAQAG
jgi:hypothetical protein